MYNLPGLLIYHMWIVNLVECGAMHLSAACSMTLFTCKTWAHVHGNVLGCKTPAVGTELKLKLPREAK